MSRDSSRPRPVKPGTEYPNRLLDDSTQESCVARWVRTVRIPGRMPGACVLHASLPVFPCHVQPLQGGYVAKHRSSPIHRSFPPSYLAIRTSLARPYPRAVGGSTRRELSGESEPDDNSPAKVFSSHSLTLFQKQRQLCQLFLSALG